MTGRLRKLHERSPLPTGTIPVGIGLAVTGVASYAFLVVSARALGPDAYSGLAVLWAAVFLVGPGFFVPLEQEVGRLLAGRAALGLGGGPVVRRAAALGAVLALAIVAGCLVLAPVLTGRVFGDDLVLFVGLLLGVVGYYVANLAEGVLSGNGRFGRYGIYLGGEAVIRLAICLVCVVVGVTTAGPFGLALGIAPVVAVLPAFVGVKGLAEPGPAAEWRDLTLSLGALVAGSLFAQLLVNAPPLLLEILGPGRAASAEGTTVGAFTAALILARVPFFLFQAVQAALLPSLASLAARQHFDEFRRVMIRLVALVGGLAAIGVVLAFLVGEGIVHLVFGADFAVTNRTVGMLALGSGLYLLAMALAQAVIALGATRFVAIGWGIGATTSIIVAVASPRGLLGVELGYVIGSAAAVVTMTTGLRLLWSSGARPHTPDVIEAVYDLPLEP